MDTKLCKGATTVDAYNVPEESRNVFLKGILGNGLIQRDLPEEWEACVAPIKFEGSKLPCIPINWRFAESVSSLKAFEAMFINVLLGRKYNLPPQEVVINT